MAPFTVTPWMPDVPAVCPALFRLRWSAWPIAIACAPALLQAQTLPAPSAEDTRLPDITVTATRQPERVQDVAAAVGVVKGADVRVAGPGMQLSESLVSVPGVAALNRQNMAQDLQISSRAFGARSTFGVRGVRLYVTRAALPAPAAGEYYRADLIGLAVTDANGTDLGSVRAVEDFGGGPFIELDRDGPEGPLCIPFTPATCSVDLEARTVRVTVPDGLLDPAPKREDEGAESETATHPRRRRGPMRLRRRRS